MKRRRRLPVFGKYPSNGEYYVYCDRSGRKMRKKDTKKTWDNFIVQPKDWEPRQPLDFPPQVRPERRIWNTRPEPTNDFFACTYYVDTDGSIIYSCVPRDLELATVAQIAAVEPVVTSATTTVNEEAEPGSLVTTVVATDPQSLTLTYEILSGDTGNNFYINSTDGEIRVNTSEGLDDGEQVSLTIEVTNTENIPSTGVITVNVLGVVDPTTYGSTVVWNDTQIAASIVASASSVSQWTDQTINLYSYVQATGSNQPTEITDAANGFQAIRFSEATSDDGLFFAIEEQANLSFAHNADSTIVWVGKYYDFNHAGGVIAKAMFGNSPVNGEAGLQVSVNTFSSGQRDLLIQYRNTANVIVTINETITTFEDTTFIVVLQYDASAQLKLLVTGNSAISDITNTTALSNSPAGNVPVRNFFMGTNAANQAANSNNFRGQTQAFYMWDELLEDSEVTSLVAALKTQWGIS